jgi:hypothetical protein
MAQTEVFQPVHPSWTAKVPDFDGVYERILTLSYDSQEEKPRPRTLGLITSPRRCALCEKAEPAVSFRKVAHLIAACLGNRSLFSREDCDACNAESGETLDDDLGKMLLPQRVIGRIRSRAGTAKLKAPEGSASIGGGPFDAAVPVVLDANDDHVQLAETGDKSVALKLRVPSYRPMWAIRSLMRSAWLGLDSTYRERFPWLCELVRGQKVVHKPEYFELFLPGGMLGGVLLELWQRRESSTVQSAPLVLRLAFVNTLIIWCAPSPDSLEHAASLLPPVALVRPSWARHITLEGPDAREDTKTVTYTLAYEQRTQAPADGTLVKSPRKNRRHLTVRLEFEGPGAKASLAGTFLVKENMDGPRPYFEFRGGSLTGWLSVQLKPDRRASFRFDFAPHLGTPGDALSTHQFLTALGEAGAFRVINGQTGDKIAVITKGSGTEKFVLPNISRFLSDLEHINRTLGVDLRIPPPPTELPREVALIVAGLKHGRVAVTPGSPLQIVMPARIARSLLAGPGTLSATGTGWEVFGTKVDIGPSRIFFVGSSACDLPGLERSLNGTADEDPVEVELTCDQVIHEFERWLPAPRDDG